MVRVIFICVGKIYRSPAAEMSSVESLLTAASAAQGWDYGYDITGTGLNNGHYRNCLAILMLEVYCRVLPGTGAK